MEGIPVEIIRTVLEGVLDLVRLSTKYTYAAAAFSAPHYFVKFSLSVIVVTFPENLSSWNLTDFKYFVVTNTPITRANKLYRVLQSQKYSFQISPSLMQGTLVEQLWNLQAF